MIQVGTVNPDTDHAAQDIDGAIAVGLDAFAMNVGQPDQPWAKDCIQQLMDYASGKEFGLFFSFDFYGNGDISAHQALYDQFKDHPAYYHYGPNDLNVVSTYSGGSLGPEAWASFRETNNVFLIPNVESDGDYYNNPSAFFEKWSGSLDGVFSWETAWPEQSDSPSNVTSTRDEAVKLAADAATKAYVMGKRII